MTTAKTIFLRRDPLGGPTVGQWWNNIAHDPRFAMVLTFCRADLAEYTLSQERQRGIELALNTLLTLSETESAGLDDLPGPGLIHEMPAPKPSQRPPISEPPFNLNPSSD